MSGASPLQGIKVIPSMHDLEDIAKDCLSPSLGKSLKGKYSSIVQNLQEIRQAQKMRKEYERRDGIKYNNRRFCQLINERIQTLDKLDLNQKRNLRQISTDIVYIKKICGMLKNSGVKTKEIQFFESKMNELDQKVETGKKINEINKKIFSLQLDINDLNEQIGPKGKLALAHAQHLDIQKLDNFRQKINNMRSACSDLKKTINQAENEKVQDLENQIKNLDDSLTQLNFELIEEAGKELLWVEDQKLWSEKAKKLKERESSSKEGKEGGKQYITAEVVHSNIDRPAQESFPTTIPKKSTVQKSTRAISSADSTNFHKKLVRLSGASNLNILINRFLDMPDDSPGLRLSLEDLHKYIDLVEENIAIFIDNNLNELKKNDYPALKKIKYLINSFKNEIKQGIALEQTIPKLVTVEKTEPTKKINEPNRSEELVPKQTLPDLATVEKAEPAEKTQKKSSVTTKRPETIHEKLVFLSKARDLAAINRAFNEAEDSSFANKWIDRFLKENQSQFTEEDMQPLKQIQRLVNSFYKEHGRKRGDHLATTLEIIILKLTPSVQSPEKTIALMKPIIVKEIEVRAVAETPKTDYEKLTFLSESPNVNVLINRALNKPDNAAVGRIDNPEIYNAVNTTIKKIIKNNRLVVSLAALNKLKPLIHAFLLRSGQRTGLGGAQVKLEKTIEKAVVLAKECTLLEDKTNFHNKLIFLSQASDDLELINRVLGKPDDAPIKNEDIPRAVNLLKNFIERNKKRAYKADIPALGDLHGLVLQIGVRLKELLEEGELKKLNEEMTDAINAAEEVILFSDEQVLKYSMQEAIDLSLTKGGCSQTALASSIKNAKKHDVAEFVTLMRDKFEKHAKSEFASAHDISKTMITTFFEHASPLQQKDFFSFMSEKDDRFLTYILTALPKNITQLELGSCKSLNDRHINIIARFNQLKSLSLRGSTGVTAQGIEKIAQSENLSNLKKLNLINCPQVNNENILTIFKNMKNLNNLLFNTPLKKKS